jgi:hypothetical protein
MYLGGRLGDVPHRIQTVGDLPHLLGLAPHLDDPARVVSDGSEVVHG